MLELMRHLDLFAGIGGFSLGMEAAGMETVGFVENDKHCQTVLKRHWPEVPIWGDIHDFRGRDLREPASRGAIDPVLSADHDRRRETGTGLPGGTGEQPTDPLRGGTDGHPGVDVLTGGFPCTDYSVAGKRAGLAGDRGALWWELHRIVAECRPTWVVGENVPGLLSSNNGDDFRTIVGSLVQLGYGVSWAVLDSQFWGVAQRRRRVFIVGHSGGQPRPEILALSEGLFGYPPPSREEGPAVAARVGDSLGEISGALETRPGDRERPEGLVVPATAYALTSREHKGVSKRESATTLMADLTVRRLTPVECARLQGFDDDWNDHLSDTQRYRQYGNAVTVNVTEWIGRRIMET